VIFNYILKLLYLGVSGRAAHRKGQRWATRSTTPGSIVLLGVETSGCFDAIFAGSVSQLHQKEYLDISVIHGDGYNQAQVILASAGTKHFKGDKVVAFCDRLQCNRLYCCSWQSS